MSDKYALDIATAAEETDFFYANDGGPKRDEEVGYIGRLRGDFGKSGTEFWTTWADGYANLKTTAFKAEFDAVINAMRGNGVLQNLNAMTEYCRRHPQAALDNGRGYNYGFKIKTDNHIYFLRCGTIRGDYNFYCYAYERSRSEKCFPALAETPPKPSLTENIAKNKSKAAAQSKTAAPKSKNREEIT